MSLKYEPSSEPIGEALNNRKMLVSAAEKAGADPEEAVAFLASMHMSMSLKYEP